MDMARKLQESGWSRARFVAVEPSTGAVLREATSAEADAYRATNRARPYTREGVARVGEVLVDVDAGPGLWFGGAGGLSGRGAPRASEPERFGGTRGRAPEMEGERMGTTFIIQAWTTDNRWEDEPNGEFSSRESAHDACASLWKERPGRLRVVAREPGYSDRGIWEWDEPTDGTAL